LEIYLIRHAQSTNQVLDSRDDTIFDPHLTDLGERQADLLASYFAAGRERVRSAESGIDRIVCSPMWRALQTARPLAEALDLRPRVWTDVHELVTTSDVYPGSTREEILDAFPNYRVPDDITDNGWWNEGRETLSACLHRAIRVAEQLRQEASSEASLAIVSHVRFIDSLLKAFLNQLPGRDLYFHQGNTGVSRIALTQNGLEIRYINRLAHLPPDLIS